MPTNYTTKTASLRATKADITNAKIKRLKIFDTQSNEYITLTKNDCRAIQNDYDIWSPALKVNSDKTLILTSQYIPDATEWYTDNNSLLSRISKVEKDEAFDSSGNHVCYMQTDKITRSGLVNRKTDGSWTLSTAKRGIFYGASNLTTFNSDLTSLVDGTTMFTSCNSLTGNNENGWFIPLPNLSVAYQMFYGDYNLKGFVSDMPVLTIGARMFYGCSNLFNFQGKLSNLENGAEMFYNCTNLEVLTDTPYCYYDAERNVFKNVINQIDLSNLRFARRMFESCKKIKSFSARLDNLRDGLWMFKNCQLSDWNVSSLPSLVDGWEMFLNNSTLTSFVCDMSELKRASQMFSGCSLLTEFMGDLSSVVYGNGMFDGCKLSPESVANIAFSIPTLKLDDNGNKITNVQTYIEKHGLGGNATSSSFDNNSLGNKMYSFESIGIDCANTEEARTQFAKDAGFDNWADLESEFTNKNWNVTFQNNGVTAQDVTETMSFYTKLVQVDYNPNSEEVQSIPQYVSNDGSTFYNIEWHNDTKGIVKPDFDEYESFTQAITNYGVKSL